MEAIEGLSPPVNDLGVIISIGFIVVASTGGVVASVKDPGVIISMGFIAVAPNGSYVGCLVWLCRNRAACIAGTSSLYVEDTSRVWRLGACDILMPEAPTPEIPTP